MGFRFADSQFDPVFGVIDAVFINVPGREAPNADAVNLPLL